MGLGPQIWKQCHVSKADTVAAGLGLTGCRESTALRMCISKREGVGCAAPRREWFTCCMLWRWQRGLASVSAARSCKWKYSSEFWMMLCVAGGRTWWSPWVPSILGCSGRSRVDVVLDCASTQHHCSCCPCTPLQPAAYTLLLKHCLALHEQCTRHDAARVRRSWNAPQAGRLDGPFQTQPDCDSVLRAPLTERGCARVATFSWK